MNTVTEFASTTSNGTVATTGEQSLNAGPEKFFSPLVHQFLQYLKLEKR